MYKYRDSYVYGKKDLLKHNKQTYNNSSLNYYSTIQSKQTEDKPNRHNGEKHMQTEITQSSRIADEGEVPQNGYQSFRASILQKVQCIEEESNKLLQKKERQLYFLKIQLKGYEQRLKQADEQLIRKDKKISRLEYQMQRLKNGTQKNDFSYKNQQMHQIERENQKLKESLRILIQQKNLNWKTFNYSSENFSQNKLNMPKMKQQIEELRQMVLQMEQTIKNCPKCFTLNREKQELSIAYNCLLKQHSELTAEKSNKEKQFIENISNKIKENQNILRQNILLKQEKEGRPYIRFKGQRIKDSVAKRCRTLTDQF